MPFGFLKASIFISVATWILLKRWIRLNQENPQQGLSTVDLECEKDIEAEYFAEYEIWRDQDGARVRLVNHPRRLKPKEHADAISHAVVAAQAIGLIKSGQG
jgi:hypothetical protein